MTPPAVERPLSALVTKVRGRHKRRRSGIGAGNCIYCNEEFPCSAWHMADAIEALEKENAALPMSGRAGRDEPRSPEPCPHHPDGCRRYIVHEEVLTRAEALEKENAALKESRTSLLHTIENIENMETHHVTWKGPEGEEYHPDWCRECRVTELEQRRSFLADQNEDLRRFKAAAEHKAEAAAEALRELQEAAQEVCESDAVHCTWHRESTAHDHMHQTRAIEELRAALATYQDTPEG